MTQSSNKIQISKIVKAVAIFAFLMALLYTISSLTIFDRFDEVVITDLLFSLLIPVGYWLTFFCLLLSKKIGWYIGAVTFGGVAIFIVKLLFEYNFIVTDIALLVANLVAFGILIIGRKNYFVAVEEAKKQAKNI